MIMTCIVPHDFLYDQLEFQLADSRKKEVYDVRLMQTVQLFSH